MPASPLIPSLDPTPDPGPAWLFHILWVVTFLLHIVFMNAVLGGSILSTVALLLGKRAPGRSIASTFVELNSWTISLAITFGIAPLLFLQVVYGRLFYTATVLVAPAWLGMLVLLTAAYYLNYVAKFRYRKGKDATLPVALTAVLFLAIAALQVAVSLLHMQPERWEAANASFRAVFADPSYAPRLLHFVLAAVSMCAVGLAWMAVRDPAAATEENRARARFGILVALGATVLQVLDGFWLLLSMPGAVLRALMRSGPAFHIPLDLGILSALGLLVVLSRITDPFAQRTLVRRSMELLGLATAVMVVTRHQVRGAFVTASGAGANVAVAPQWGVIAVFFVCLLLCGGLTVYVLVRSFGREAVDVGR